MHKDQRNEKLPEAGEKDLHAFPSSRLHWAEAALQSWEERWCLRK